MKIVQVDEETHCKLKSVAKKKGMKLSRLVDAICRHWLEGIPFFLPDALPKGKQENSGGAK